MKYPIDWASVDLGKIPHLQTAEIPGPKSRELHARGAAQDSGRREFQTSMHGIGAWRLHYNMFLVAQKARPKFTIIDGLEGLQGNGHTKGDPIDHRIAIAGTDVMAVDRVASGCMGVDSADMGYLNFSAEAGLGKTDLTRIKIIGSEKPADHIVKYRLNQNIDWQMQWRNELPLVK